MRCWLWRGRQGQGHQQRGLGWGSPGAAPGPVMPEAATELPEADLGSTQPACTAARGLWACARTVRGSGRVLGHQGGGGASALGSCRWCSCWCSCWGHTVLWQGAALSMRVRALTQCEEAHRMRQVREGAPVSISGAGSVASKPQSMARATSVQCSSVRFGSVQFSSSRCVRPIKPLNNNLTSIKGSCCQAEAMVRRRLPLDRAVQNTTPAWLGAGPSRVTHTTAPFLSPRHRWVALRPRGPCGQTHLLKSLCNR